MPRGRPQPGAAVRHGHGRRLAGYLYFELGYARAVMTKDWKYIAVRYPAETIEAIRRAAPDRLPRLMAYIGRMGIGTRGADRPGFWDADQLYDLQADPGELTNLAADPKYADQLQSLRETLTGCIQSIGRPFGEFLPGGNAAPPGQVDAQIALVKQIEIQGKNVSVPPEAAGQTGDRPPSQRKRELRKNRKPANETICQDLSVASLASGTLAWLLPSAYILGLALPAASGEFDVEIRQLTHGPKHHFFGYIGHVQNIPWNGDGRYIVALRTSFQDRMPDPGEAGRRGADRHAEGQPGREDRRVACVELPAGDDVLLEPHAADRELIFNDRDPATNRVFAVVYDIAARKRVREYRFNDTPIGNSGVAQGGGYFLGLNYGRMARLRPVTGYPGALDWNPGEPRRPTTACSSWTWPRAKNTCWFPLPIWPELWTPRAENCSSTIRCGAAMIAASISTSAANSETATGASTFPCPFGLMELV